MLGIVSTGVSIGRTIDRHARIAAAEVRARATSAHGEPRAEDHRGPEAPGEPNRGAAQRPRRRRWEARVGTRDAEQRGRAHRNASDDSSFGHGTSPAPAAAEGDRCRHAISRTVMVRRERRRRQNRTHAGPGSRARTFAA